MVRITSSLFDTVKPEKLMAKLFSVHVSSNLANVS